MRPALRGAALSLATVALAVVVFGATVAGAQGAARWSARVSFLLFAVAFAGPSWDRLFPGSSARAVAAREWPLTLAFIGSHLVHLVLFLSLVFLILVVRLAASARRVPQLKEG